MKWHICFGGIAFLDINQAKCLRDDAAVVSLCQFQETDKDRYCVLSLMIAWLASGNAVPYWKMWSKKGWQRGMDVEHLVLKKGVWLWSLILYTVVVQEVFYEEVFCAL